VALVALIEVQEFVLSTVLDVPIQLLRLISGDNIPALQVRETVSIQSTKRKPESKKASSPKRKKKRVKLPKPTLDRPVVKYRVAIEKLIRFKVRCNIFCRTSHLPVR